MASWRTFCAGLPVENDMVTVLLEAGRSHRVRVLEEADVYTFHAFAARAAAVRGVSDLELRLWRHNHESRLVGLYLDERQRVCATGWIPKQGVAQEEFLFVLRRVASHADRLEHLLTGRDVE